MQNFYDDGEYDINVGKEENIIEYLGEGISERNLFNLGDLNTNTGVDRINQSIRQILETPLGSRFFIPSFGSRIKDFIMEPNDMISSELIRNEVIRAIKQWEHRVDLRSVRTSFSGDECFIEVRYVIKPSSSEEIYIFKTNRGIKEVGL